MYPEDDPNIDEKLPFHSDFLPPEKELRKQTKIAILCLTGIE